MCKIMLNIRYSNFVRPSSAAESNNSLTPSLSGENAKRIYLEEIEVESSVSSKRLTRSENRAQQRNIDIKLESVSNKDLFLSAQNNDVQTLKQMLDTCPNMLNTTDDYGWSLLMIGCQANSVDAVKELLKRGINTSTRDKAGNSAQSLVIKNRNLTLADILLSYKSSENLTAHKTSKNATQNPKSSESSTAQNIPKNATQKIKLASKEHYFCEICNKEFPDKEEHVSSTVHNIDASKGKKIPSSYAIPASNKGYQIMLKVGWDKESGLGPDGSGKKYPIKTVQKRDRKGLGLDKRKKMPEVRKETVNHLNRKLLERECKNSRSMEINFRRQFY